MPCYHPRVMVRSDAPNDNGKYTYSFATGIPSYIEKPEIGEFHFMSYLKDFDKEKYILVPCKKCIGCRLEYSRKWADRMMLELDHSKTALFLTLTYDNEHLSYGDEVFIPDSFTGEAIPTKFPTTVKRDIQLFNKRLRERFAPKQIRFYIAAEYGPSTLRPHYHGVYFGLSLKDFPDSELQNFNVHKQPIYKSELLSNLWKNGFVSMANVSWQTCAYVARYSLKKLGSEKGFAESRGVLPEWSLMSRRPGLAGYFHIDHPELLENPKDKIFLSDSNGVKPVNSIGLPEYVFNKLADVNPELYDSIKEERRQSMVDSFMHEFLKQDLNEHEYQSLKEKNHENSLKALARNTVE